MNADLLGNLDKLHTTELGVMRIKKNLNLNTEDVVKWCRERIHSANQILRRGKNWYVYLDDCLITINAYSHTIITAHKAKS